MNNPSLPLGADPALDGTVTLEPSYGFTGNSSVGHAGPWSSGHYNPAPTILATPGEQRLTQHAQAGGRALICGSVAFDTIMVFEDRFKNHILPDKIHMLNVSFLVPQMRREYGGCGGNIAYNLKLLGDTGYLMATVGRDAGLYLDWMRQNGIPTDYVRVLESEHTAQGFVTTDLDDNQIWALSSGRHATLARQ